MFYIYRNQGQSKMCEIIDAMVARQDELDNKKFYSKIPRRSMVNEVKKLYEAVLNSNV